MLIPRYYNPTQVYNSFGRCLQKSLTEIYYNIIICLLLLLNGYGNNHSNHYYRCHPTTLSQKSSLYCLISQHTDCLLIRTDELLCYQLTPHRRSSINNLKFLFYHPAMYIILNIYIYDLVIPRSYEVLTTHPSIPYFTIVLQPRNILSQF